MSVNEYPIDTDALDKGSKIAPETIEGIFGVQRDHAKYALKRMHLAAYIMLRLEGRGVDAICCADPDVNGGLRILTDSQAAGWTEDQFKAHVRGMASALDRQQHVDRAQLKDAEVGKHDRNLTVNGATLAGAIRERRQAQRITAPKPRERLTPDK